MMDDGWMMIDGPVALSCFGLGHGIMVWLTICLSELVMDDGWMDGCMHDE